MLPIRRRFRQIQNISLHGRPRGSPLRGMLEFQTAILATDFQRPIDIDNEVGQIDF